MYDRQRAALKTHLEGGERESFVFLFAATFSFDFLKAIRLTRHTTAVLKPGLDAAFWDTVKQHVMERSTEGGGERMIQTQRETPVQGLGLDIAWRFKGAAECSERASELKVLCKGKETQTQKGLGGLSYCSKSIKY